LQFLLENGKKRTFSYKVACKKFSYSGQKGGHRTVPPINTPLTLTYNKRATNRMSAAANPLQLFVQ